MRALNELAMGDVARVGRIKNTGGMKRRLMDLGLTKGAKVSCLFSAPGGSMRAYRVRQAVIALRQKDAALVELEEEPHG